MSREQHFETFKEQSQATFIRVDKTIRDTLNKDRKMVKQSIRLFLHNLIASDEYKSFNARLRDEK